jgi:hypothetical protein
MQTFLPYASFSSSVSCLDRQRLGNQRVEARQALTTLLLEDLFWNDYPSFVTLRGLQLKKTDYAKNRFRELITLFLTGYEDVKYEVLKTSKFKYNHNIPWINHPCIRMWRGYDIALKFYHDCAIAEWIARGYKNTMPFLTTLVSSILEGGYRWEFDHVHNVYPDYEDPKWLGDENFHLSHRTQNTILSMGGRNHLVYHMFGQ